MELGVTRVMKFFGGVAFFGTVRAFCAPWFRIQYDDGDFEDVAKHELAPLIFFAEESFYDPRLWHYDFSVMNPHGRFGIPRGPDSLRRRFRLRPAP